MLSCEEVKINLHDFVDEKLDKGVKKEVENHIRTCETCLLRYKKVIKFFDSLKELSDSIEPPPDLIEKFSAELLKKKLSEKEEIKSSPKINIKKIKKEQARQNKALKESRGAARKSMVSKTIFSASAFIPRFSKSTSLNLKKTLFIVSPLLMIGIGYIVYDFMQHNSPWNVTPQEGIYLIDGKVDNSNKLFESSMISTRENSSVLLNVPKMGSVELFSNTNVLLLKAKNGDNRITLNKGGLKVVATVLIPHIAVEFKKASVYNVGGVFNLNVDGANDAQLYVEFGLAKIVREGITLMVDEGYFCELRSGKPLGTPYRFDATDSLKKLVNKFDIDGPNDEVINKILTQIKPSDALTLLTMIPKVSESKRQILFQKISNFFPPPPNVTHRGVINLEQEMLEKWWNEIEWQI